MRSIMSQVRRFLLLISLLFLSSPLHSQDVYNSSNEQLMIESWDSFNINNPNSFTHFYLSELKDSSEWKSYEEFYSMHLREVSKKIKTKHSVKKKGEIIYKYLHSELFKKYVIDVAISDMFKRSEYNCVTATALFVDFSEEFGIPYKIFETPTHVYPIIYDKGKEVIVELTVPKKGYNFKNETDAIISSLLENELITQEELSSKGKRKIYSEYVEETKEITKKELIAIQYFNNSLFLFENQKYDLSLTSLEKGINLYDSENFLTTYAIILNNSEILSKLDHDSKTSILESSFSMGLRDSLISEVLIQNTGLRVEELISEKSDFEKSLELIDTLQNSIIQDSSFINKVINLRHAYYQDKTENFAVRGQSKEALESLSEALKIKSTPRLVDLYISQSTSYSIQLAQFGKFDEALEKISAIYSEYGDENKYPIINDTYVRILMAHTMQKEITKENSKEIISNLKLALTIQPENFMVKNASSKVFHDLAMEQVRESDYENAKKLVNQGLELAPNNEMLKSDLKLINEMLELK